MRALNEKRIGALGRAIRAFELIDGWLQEFKIPLAKAKCLELEETFVGEASIMRSGTWFAWYLQIRSPKTATDPKREPVVGVTLYFDRQHQSFMTIEYYSMKDQWRLMTEWSDQSLADQLGLTPQCGFDKPISQEQAMVLIERASAFYRSRRGPYA